MKKIVITGGHLTPALAVIEELQKESGWEIIFIGRKSAAEGDNTPSVESEIIPQMGIIFLPLLAGRIQRRFTRWTIPAFLRIPLGFFQAFNYLGRFKPDVVLSFGGYVSVPVVFAAWLLGIPIITHEQTTVKGLATKFNTFFVRKIAVSWSESLNQFPKEKVVLTGNPIREEIFKFNEKIWQILNFPKGLPLVFITGGNQGSHLLNQTVEEVLGELIKITNVFHQCGHINALGDFESLGQTKEKLPPNLRSRYHVKKYLDVREMGTLLNKATVVISRAGANTIAELAALGKPALLIPLPWLYQDEQTKNAQMLAKSGMAEILPQKEMTGQRFLAMIHRMLENFVLYQKKAREAKKLVKLTAAKQIVDLAKETAREA